MSRIDKSFMRVVLGLMGILLLYFAYTAWFRQDAYMSFIVKEIPYPWFLFVIAVFLFFGVSSILFRWIDRQTERKLHIMTVALFGLMVLGQMVLLCTVDSIHVADDLMLQDTAKLLADGIRTSLYSSDPTYYFNIYGNNNFVLTLTTHFFKLCRWLSIVQVEKVLVFITAVCVDLAIWFLYRTVFLLTDRKKAVKVLLLNVMNPLSVMVIFWTYTCLYSMPFTTGIIYLITILYKRELSVRQRLLMTAGIGFLVVCGYYLRPTVVIPVIAVFLCGFLFHKEGWFWKNRSLVICLVVVMLLSFVGVKKYSKQYVADTFGNFPITHWLMLGMMNNYDFELVKYTASFPTKDEKVQGNLAKMEEVIQEEGFSGVMKHYVDRIPYSWNEGVCTSLSRIGNIRKPFAFYQCLGGEKKDFTYLYMQSFRIFLLLLAAVSCLIQFSRRQYDYRFFFVLAVFGGVVFYTFWEAKPAYSLPFIPLLLCLTEDGVESVVYALDIKKLFRKVMPWILLVTSVTAVVNYHGFTQVKRAYHKPSIQSRHLEITDLLEDTSAKNKVYYQKFYSKESFNQLRLRAEKISDTNCVYEVSLFCGKKQLMKKELRASELSGVWTTIDVPQISAAAQERKYTIKIRSLTPSVPDSIGWGFQELETYDGYRGKNNFFGKRQVGDLLLCVQQEYIAPYMSSVEYGIFWGVILALEALIMFLSVGNTSTSNREKSFRRLAASVRRCPWTEKM